MCGICGIIKFKGEISSKNLENMVGTLAHRGPDNNSFLTLEKGDTSIGLAHARLSIIDLSEAANQPMTYKDLHIVFNGEIYNFEEIKEELEAKGHTFKLNSDTEMILHAFEEWGVKCVDKFIGMFAFVLCDLAKDKIYFFRDRAGVKPLYYYRDSEIILFGSELKALCAHSSFKRELSLEAVAHYFKLGYVPTPLSIYKNTFKLESGCYSELDMAGQNFTIHKYWDANTFYSLPQSKLTYDEAKIDLEKLLISACKYRMISDVPVGVFLSGGFDSALVASILQKHTDEKIKTFTIGFDEGNNEAPFAKEISAYLGTEHTEYICRVKEAQELIPELPFFYDEPFADSSAIPTILVSRLARQKVTVALSADGGDELFCGYNGYRSIARNIDSLSKIEKYGGKVFSGILKVVSPILKEDSFLAHKVNSMISILNVNKEYRVSLMHEQIQSLGKKTFSNVLKKKIKYPENVFHLTESAFKDRMSVPMALDYKNYMQHDILTKVDRATMSTSLEGREPLLDHRVLEFSATLPIAYKFDGVTTKKILKDIVYKYIPKEMMDRPKTGFSLPIYDWLRTDLSYLIDQFMSEDQLQLSNLFNASYVNKLITLFKAKQLHDETIIWKILQFQMWYKEWMGDPSK